MNNNLPKNYTVRPPRMEDAEACVAMFNATSRALQGTAPFTVEDQRHEWQTPRLDLERDMRLVLAPDGQVAGYYEVWDLENPHTTAFCWGRTHPAHTGRGVGSYLLEWAEQRARLAIPQAPPEARVVLLASPEAVNEAARKLMLDRGFALIRQALRMFIEFNGPPPAPQWPQGITVRTVVRDQEEKAAFAAGREAFIDHWGHVERPFEEEWARWSHFALNEDYDPSLWFLALDGDEIAGNSMCRPKVDNDPSIGWVASLSVRRPWRKQGLGLALLLHSFGEFYRRGYRKVGLGVDAQNISGALRLYEKAGMHSDPKFTFHTYEKELRPGVDLMRKA